MHIVADTIDDAMFDLFSALLKNKTGMNSTRGNVVSELAGVLIEIKLPRARLSRTETRGKPFSCLGELLWYLSRDNKLEFISHYIPRYSRESEDGETVHDGYGRRLFDSRGNDQLKNIIELLKKRPQSRRAVIQLFDSEDLSRHHRVIPCTTTMQFLIRDDLLHLIVTMRSNDAYMGFPHDVFCFTMLQEIIACSLGRDIGSYKHFVGSMHLYTDDEKEAEGYLSERIQSRVEMPKMPDGDPWPAIQKVLDAEFRIRTKTTSFDPDNIEIEPYWLDLIRLLEIFDVSGDVERIEEIKSKMYFKKYEPYIEGRKHTRRRQTVTPLQPLLKL